MQHQNTKCATLSKRLVLSGCAWVRCQPARRISTPGMARQTHYDTLGLRRRCSPAEIKGSFIRLSKELHPDTNPTSLKLHNRFVAVNEAYSVLSKPHLRWNYDAQLTAQERTNMHTYGGGIRTNAPRDRVVYQYETPWENRDRSEDHKYEDRPYYGIRGIKNKLPNSYIATGAVVFMLVGAIFHFFLAKTSSAFAIGRQNQLDQEAGHHHMLVREQARANGNQLQMSLLKQRIMENKK